MKKLFNSNWKFWEGSDSFALVWNVPENAKDISLPHDSMQHKKPSSDAINGNNTGFVDGGINYYVKHFEVLDETKRYNFIFEGIYRNASIYINGQFAGENKFGYSTFKVDVTKYLNFEKKNEIRIIVRNNNDGSRWYAGGGIYRDVYLEVTDHTYITSPKFTTTAITETCANIAFKADIINNKPVNQKFILEILLDEEKFTFESLVFANSKLSLEKALMIAEPKLWSGDNPYLYNVKVKLTTGEDSYQTDLKFGIRTVSCDYVNGLLINGKQEKLRGACIHHDSGILGVKTFFDYEYFKIKKLKDAGFNAIRMSHNPVSPQMATACDMLGMYIMDETFDMWHRSKSDYDFSMNFEQEAFNEIQLMVDNDYNHPSVILYSLGNEIPDVGTAKGIETLSKLNTYIKSIDNSRPTMLSINGVFAAGDSIGQIMEDVLKQNNDFSGNVNNFMQVMDKYMSDIVRHPKISEIINQVDFHSDLVGYNYMHGRYQQDSDLKRVIVGSETYPPNISSNWQNVTKYNNIIGDFTWTGWDYIGEAGVGIPAYKFGDGGFGAKYPARLSYCGDFDLIGNRRPLSYYREIVFGLETKPYITIINPFENQDKLIKTPWVLSDAKAIYHGDDNQEITSQIYANCDSVKLYLNDTLIGEEKTQDCIATFNFKYNEGTLRAYAIKDGVVIGESQLMSQNLLVSDNLIVDVQEGITEQLKFIRIKSASDYIKLNDTKLSLEVVDGELLGFGNGDPKNPDSYLTSSSYLFDGSALAIVSSETTSIKINEITYNI